MSKIRIVIADDHHILLDGLKAMLEKQQNIDVLGLYDNGRPLLDDIQKLKPDLALVDINMPGMQGPDSPGKLKSLIHLYTSSHCLCTMMQGI